MWTGISGFTFLFVDILYIFIDISYLRFRRRRMWMIQIYIFKFCWKDVVFHRPFSVYYVFLCFAVCCSTVNSLFSICHNNWDYILLSKYFSFFSESSEKRFKKKKCTVFNLHRNPIGICLKAFSKANLI